MGNRSEEKKVLSALRHTLGKKAVGQRRFVFRTSSEATEGLGLKGQVRTQTFNQVLKSLSGGSEIHMVTFNGVTTITIPDS